MGRLFRKAIFGILGAILLCLPAVRHGLPATAWAVPLAPDTQQITDQRVRPLDPRVVPFGTPTTTEPLVETIEAPYLSKDTVTAGKELLVSIGQSSGIKLTPGAPYEIFLDDTSLGSYPADQNGQLFIQVTIPSTTTPGTHTLKVTNQTILALEKIINYTK